MYEGYFLFVKLFMVTGGVAEVAAMPTHPSKTSIEVDGWFSLFVFSIRGKERVSLSLFLESST